MKYTIAHVSAVDRDDMAAILRIFDAVFAASRPVVVHPVLVGDQLCFVGGQTGSEATQ
jgi:hypothetical protein